MKTAKTSTLVILLDEDDELVRFAQKTFTGPQCVIAGLDDLGGRLEATRIEALSRTHGCDDVALGVLDFDFLPKPIRYKRTLARCRVRNRFLFDSKGERQSVGKWRLLFVDYPNLVVEMVLGILVVAWYFMRVVLLEKQGARVSSNTSSPNQKRTVAYLRAHFFRAKFGGTLAHTLGVLTGLRDNGYRTTVVTSDPLLGVPDDSPVVQVPPSRRFQTFGEIREMAHNVRLLRRGLPLLRKLSPEFIYFRNTSFCIAPLLISRRLGIPFVLEFNSSDYWRAREWKDRSYHFPSLLRRAEISNLRLADLVVTISEACKEQILATTATPAHKILVNPNAVDPRKFSDRLDGKTVRTRFGVSASAVVFGFSGTFMAYHGVGVLARPIAQLRVETDVSRVHFLLIGKGGDKESTEAFLGREGAHTMVTFTGMVPFDDIQDYLAACDVLVAPHDPPPSDTEFFGSPIKVFEYMAMGRAIIASEVGQVATLLTHEVDALLVPPGDEQALKAAIVRLNKDTSLREQLGRNARRKVLEDHTWKQNVELVVDALASAPLTRGEWNPSLNSREVKV